MDIIFDGDCEMEKSKTPLNVPMLFHAELFAYQRKLKEIIGPTRCAFLDPVQEIVSEIDREKRITNPRGDTLAEVLKNFSRDLIASNVAEKARFKRVGPEEYVFRIEKCVFAGQIHGLLKPKDVVCPLALAAISAFQNSTKKKARETISKFTSDGCETVIA